MHTVRSGTQSSRSHLIVSSCNTIMMAAAELIYLNTLYMFCALTCAGIETLVKTRPKQFKRISKKTGLCGIHVHSMDLSLHCNVALCTLANGFSNTIARHKVPLFVVFYCSICFLLHIFAELRCVFQQRFHSNL